MNTPINYGGPAFPLPEIEYDAHGIQPCQNQGMTLRDYFAAKAMQGFCSQCDREGCWSWNPDDAVKKSYALADAMIAERSKQP